MKKNKKITLLLVIIFILIPRIDAYTSSHHKRSNLENAALLSIATAGISIGFYYFVRCLGESFYWYIKCKQELQNDKEQK